ncbi:hypothetical protein K439DRAFT_1619011 [Ramaria rubella]|nr:hypothetical protein K439DRAFT_1619011 [Ramaria rubella]
MILKLSVLLRAAILSGPGDTCTWATGYTHTYVDTQGLDLQTLGLYPSDAEITIAAAEVHREAKSLFEYLGITPTEDDLEDEEGDYLNGWPSDGDTNEAAQLQELISLQDKKRLGYHAEDNRLIMLTFAAVSASIDDTIRINDLPKESKDGIAQDSTNIICALSVAHTPLPLIHDLPDEQVLPRDHAIQDGTNLDFAGLIERRTHHQPHHTTSGPCTRTVHSPQQPESLHKGLLHEFQQILQVQQEQDVGTGLIQKARWQGAATASTKTTGNAQNAAQVANAAATTVHLHGKTYMIAALTPN